MPAAASGVRITYSDLPTTIREWVAGLLGGPVVLAQSQPGGFSPGTADRLETGAGIRGFLKAVSPAQNAHTPDMHRREAEVVEQLPGSRRTPRLLGRYDDGNWVALLFEDVEGRTPQLPWVAAEMRSAIDALSELAESLTPSPLLGLPRLEEQLAHDFAGWRRLRSDPPADLDPWARDHLEDLVCLGDRGLAAVAGNTVVHLDVRADNLLIRPDGFVTVVDWPWAANGASWMDRLLLVDVELYGGHDPDPLVRSHLGSVDQAAMTATLAGLAGLAGYFTGTARRPAVPGGSRSRCDLDRLFRVAWPSLTA